MKQFDDAALLIVYGRYETHDRKHLAGEAIFDSLVRNGYWLAPRLPSSASDGINIVFYQAGVGFTATARLDRTEDARSSDWTLPGASPIKLFPRKLILRDVHAFDAPLHAKVILDELSFVQNKIYWGHSFRMSPRLIPIADFNIIAKTGRTIEGSASAAHGPSPVVGRESS